VCLNLENTMSDMYGEIWEAYCSSWRAVSAEEKRGLYEKCLAPDCEYNDPMVKAKGHDELLAYMIGFHQQIPGGHFVTKYFRAHNDQSIACWDMNNGDGAVVGEGISYGKYNAQGRLIAMTGFFDAPGS
jgi:hypothetical protein